MRNKHYFIKNCRLLVISAEFIPLWLIHPWWYFSQLSVIFLHNYLLFLLFFYFTILYWFCHTSTCILHGCTRVPNPEPLSHLPPHTIPLGHPSAPAPCFLYPASNLDWRFVSYMIYTCFNAILPNHPPALRTEPKRVLYTSVSLLLSRIQGCHYHLSKFHIYALVYCIDVFLSGLLHSVQ